MGRSASEGKMLGGIGLFNSSLKLPAHRFSCCSVPMTAFPFLYWPDFSGLLYFPESFFVVFYSFFMSLLAAASSAFSARPSMKLRLSVGAIVVDRS